MLLAALLVMASATAAQTPVPASGAIIVTGHAWAPFVSPMGEPYRAHNAADDTLADWFGKADANHDSLLTPGELEADADRFFSELDTNADGQIDPDELADYEWEIAPDIQAMSKTRRSPGQSAEHGKPDRAVSIDSSLGLHGALQGAARYGLLNIPEPVAAADTNFDRGISRDEFRQAALYRFQLLDRTRSGKLTLPELEGIRSALLGAGPRKRQGEVVDGRIGNPLPPGN